MSFVTCTICHSKINEFSINPEQQLIQCPTCGGVEVVDEAEAGPALFQSTARGRPFKMWLRAGDDTLTIVHPGFSVVYFSLLILISFLLTFALFFSDEPFLLVIINPLTWIVSVFWFVSLINVISVMIIQATSTDLRIRYGPFARNKKKFAVANIKQLYAKSERSGSGKNRTTTYHLILRDQSNKDQTLLTFDEPKQAQFVEQEIERYLRIEDQPIAAEMVLELAETFAEWEKFAEVNDLQYYPGKLQEGHRVVGHYHGYAVDLLIAAHRLVHRTFLTLSHTPKVEQHERLFPTLSLRDIKKLLTIPFETNWFQVRRFTGEDGGQRFRYEQYELETTSRELQLILKILYNLTEAYPQLEAYDGEAIPVLHPVASNKQHPAQTIALDLLEKIAATSIVTHNQEGNALLCVHCLLRWVIHEAEISKFTTVAYYGCPQCHRSKEYFVVDRVVAILDQQMVDETAEQGRTLVVNWLTRQSLFDFDTVEVVQANDEEAERFAVQIGNDTDPVRRPMYQEMTCLISQDCHLSANTLRILERTFGSVQRA